MKQIDVCHLSSSQKYFIREVKLGKVIKKNVQVQVIMNNGAAG